MDKKKIQTEPTPKYKETEKYDNNHDDIYPYQTFFLYLLWLPTDEI